MKVETKIGLLWIGNLVGWVLLINLVLMLIIGNRHPHTVPVVYRNFHTDLDRPDTALCYWNHGVLYIMFQTDHQDTVNEDN